MNSPGTDNRDSCGSSSNHVRPFERPVLADAIIHRALDFPAEAGRTLLTNLAGWDAREAENALDSIRVPLLAIQSTTLDTARKRCRSDQAITHPGSIWFLPTCPTPPS